MDNIEFIRLTIYGSFTGGSDYITDSKLNEYVQAKGVNAAMSWLCDVELNRLSNEATSIDDGVVTLTYQNRKAGLLGIKDKADKGLYDAPEGEKKPSIFCLGV